MLCGYPTSGEDTVQKLRAVGTWWMPGNEDRKVPGILEFDLFDAGRLTLIGSLQHVADVATPEMQEDGSSVIKVTQDLLDSLGHYGRLHGLAEGRSFTLEGCFRLNSRNGLFGHADEETIYVNRAYDGIWFEGDEVAAGHKISFVVDGLYEWVAKSGITQVIRHPTPDGEPWVELHGRGLPKETAPLPEAGEASLGQRMTTSSPKSASTLTESFVIECRYDQKIAVEELLDTASDMQDLVTIATGRSAQYEEVKVFDADLADNAVPGRKEGLPFIVWSAWTALRSEGSKPLTPRDLFFNMDDIGGMAGFARWAKIAKKYRSPLGRAMATKYAERMYVSDRLLNLAAALEGFDREATQISKGRTFAERIDRCIDIAGPQFSTLVDDASRWASELKTHRNEIAHHYGRRMREATEEQLFLADSAYWLLVFCLLREAAFDDVVFDKIRADRRVVYLAKRLRALST
jgi:hypothetical protein